MHAIFDKLSQKQNPGPELVTEFLTEIMSGNVSKKDTIQFLLGMNDITPATSEIAACVRVMRAKATPADWPGGAPDSSVKQIDTCGTGGDGAQTINVSTLTALAVAALELPGVMVTKHGNKAVSSPSGSADLLGKLGIKVDKGAGEALGDLKNTGIGFLFAPVWHPAMRFVGPARAEIGKRTIFNILGPLANPLGPDYQLAGVFSPELLDTYALTFQELGLKRAMVVHGVLPDGSILDEIAPEGKTLYRLLSGGEITSGELTPADFGVEPFSIDAIKVTSAEDATTQALNIISGKGSAEAVAMIAMQGALILQLLGEEEDLKAGVARIKNAFGAGKVAAVLDRWVKNS